MKTNPFTTEEFHARIRNQLGFTQAETGKPKVIHNKTGKPILDALLAASESFAEAETGDTVEQHGAAESFSNWLDERAQAERDALADWHDGGREELKRMDEGQ